MASFSKIEYSFQDFIKEYEAEKEAEKLAAVPPFNKSEMTEEKRIERITKSLQDYWYFDKTYFPPELYDGYANPNKMLKDLAGSIRTPGYHLFLGPRKHGKTATGKKILVWLLLTKQISVAGVYSETLIKSANMLKDLYRFICDNDKIMYDWKVEFTEANSDQVSFRVNVPKILNNLNKGYRYCASFSEGRSVKGYTKLFNRPQFLLGDDIETLESSFSRQAVQLRIDKLVEAYHSMEDNSVFLIFGNDILINSAMHQLRIQAEDKLLPKIFHLYIYKAWDKKPLWKERYPAKTEKQLKDMINPLSESDWQANYQQNPIPPEGFFFLRKHYAEYNELPGDAKGIIYCDPNLSKKGKGNTTAVTSLAYSVKTDMYYLVKGICKSFSDSNFLLDNIFEIKNSYNFLYSIGFDGNVTQESTWTQFVRNWCIINQVPFPVIEYKHYKVNELAKNAQLVFSNGKLLFPKNFSKSDDGELYLSQLFAFTGTKSSGLDDAPDSLICAFEFLHERNLARKGSRQPVTAVKDYYSIL